MTVNTLITFVVILVAAYLLRAVCRFVAMSISHLAAWRFVADLTFEIYDRLQALSLRYYQDKQTGQLMSRMVNDTRQIEVLVAHALPDLFSSLLVIGGRDDYAAYGECAVGAFDVGPGAADYLCKHFVFQKSWRPCSESIRRCWAISTACFRITFRA